MTLHGFRHTCCSLLFEAGLGIKEVQDVMGHSNVKTTLDIYAHDTKDNKINSARKLSEYVNF
ncbi:tyrosine-type recombinase/integrase [Facklamia hominis]